MTSTPSPSLSLRSLQKGGRVAACLLVCLLLFPSVAFAHHVMGIELSPEFEVLHSFAEPFLFGLAGCSSAWLFRTQSRRALYAFTATSVFGSLLAFAAILEGEGGLFLLLDALAFALAFVCLERWQRHRRNNPPL